VQRAKFKVQNLLIILLALGFGLSIVLVSAYRAGQAEVQAQTGLEEISLDEIPDAESSNTETLNLTEGTEKMDKVDYYLPYPGILPDHPLYWLKMIRDRSLLAFTKKPVDRFERLLLYADKRVGAAEALIEGGKTELGVTTATKAEKYLDQSVNQFEELAKSGRATPEINSKITKALLKHEEILIGVLNKVSDQTKPVLEQTIGKIQSNYKKIKSQFN